MYSVLFCNYAYACRLGFYEVMSYKKKKSSGIKHNLSHMQLHAYMYVYDYVRIQRFSYQNSFYSDEQNSTKLTDNLRHTVRV